MVVLPSCVSAMKLTRFAGQLHGESDALCRGHGPALCNGGSQAVDKQQLIGSSQDSI